MRVGKRPPRHQRRDDRYPRSLREGEQLLSGVRLERAATDVEHRTFGLVDERHGSGDGLLVQWDLGAVTREVELLDRRGVPPVHHRLGDVLGHVN